MTISRVGVPESSLQLSSSSEFGRSSSWAGLIGMTEERPGRSFVAAGAGGLIGLGVQQAVEGLLDGFADDLIDVAPDLALVEADDTLEGPGPISVW